MKKTVKLLAALVVISAIVVAAYFGLRLYQKQNLAKQEQDQAKQKQEQLQMEQDRAKQKQLQLEQDRVKQEQTIKEVRNVGTSIFAWLTDQMGYKGSEPPGISPIPVSLAVRSPDTLNFQARRSRGALLTQIVAQGQVNEVDLKDYPRISFDDLKKLLVPHYIQDLPEKDGWGHPYEYYLNSKDLGSKHSMAIRSPGRDGKYESSRYSVGTFPPDSFDEDIVWADGYLVRGR